MAEVSAAGFPATAAAAVRFILRRAPIIFGGAGWWAFGFSGGFIGCGRFGDAVSQEE